MEAIAVGQATAFLPGRGPALTSTGHARGMARLPRSWPQETIAYHGEVWTDARGYATVNLPPDAVPLLPPFEYELRDLEPASSARISAGLEDGRFTVATAEPHVKVAWRITGRRPAGHPLHPQQEER
jgi:hypothetical protein